MTAGPSLRFGHVELFVRDVQRARAFWEGVVGLQVTAVQHDGRVVWLRLGERELLLRPGEAPGPGERYGRGGPALVLYSDDPAAVLRQMVGRGLVVAGDDGPGCVTFHDPDGNWVQLVDPRHA